MAAWGIESLSDPRVILNSSQEVMEAVLRPTGFYNSKPRALKALAGYVIAKGGVEAFANSGEGTDVLRAELLSLWGIGPETADAILLYVLGRATFVADAYALRLAARWGLLRPEARYDEIRRLFMDNLPSGAALFNEYHALIVAHAKEVCRPRPRCEVCPLNDWIDLGHNREGWVCPKLYVI